MMKRYPPAKIPKSPVLSTASFSGHKPCDLPSILDLPQSIFTVSGRYALALALREIGIVEGDEVLLPAYHCRSMVEPVVWLKASPVFYKIDTHVSPVIEDLASKITPNTKAILVPHYFGFIQTKFPEIKALCDSKKLRLIEDCAHAFFGSSDGAAIGTIGDYVIASPWKFLPIEDGGILASVHHELKHIQQSRHSLKFELKTFINTLENADRYRRLSLINLVLKLPFRLKDMLWTALKQTETKSSDNTPTTTNNKTNALLSEFEPQLLNMQMSKVSQMILSKSSKGRMVELRRQRYQTLLEELGNITGCRPLFPALPTGIVPYLFPLVVDNPGVVFPRLKSLGVPIERFGEFLWDDVDESVCKISVDYSRRVFQFPCHQELLDTEFEWMIESIKQTF